MADNGGVRSRRSVALLALVLAGTALASSMVACTGNTPPAAQASTAPLLGHPLGTDAQQLGAPGCHPASPISTFDRFLPQVRGTGHDATLWGLLMFPHPLPPRIGDPEKIVWRMTGSGSLTLRAIAPDGGVHRTVWGPEPHGGSNWDKPGDEWGAGYVFTAPGCWDLRATRGTATADVWIRVIG